MFVVFLTLFCFYRCLFKSSDWYDPTGEKRGLTCISEAVLPGQRQYPKIDQFRYTKNQSKTVHLSMRLRGITTECVGLIPQGVLLRSVAEVCCWGLLLRSVVEVCWSLLQSAAVFWDVTQKSAAEETRSVVAEVCCFKLNFNYRNWATATQTIVYYVFTSSRRIICLSRRFLFCLPS